MLAVIERSTLHYSPRKLYSHTEHGRDICRDPLDRGVECLRVLNVAISHKDAVISDKADNTETPLVKIKKKTDRNVRMSFFQRDHFQ